MAISEKTDAMREASMGWAILCASISVLCDVVFLSIYYMSHFAFATDSYPSVIRRFALVLVAWDGIVHGEITNLPLLVVTLWPLTKLEGSDLTMTGQRDFSIVPLKILYT